MVEQGTKGSRKSLGQRFQTQLHINIAWGALKHERPRPAPQRHPVRSGVGAGLRVVLGASWIILVGVGNPGLGSSLSIKLCYFTLLSLHFQMVFKLEICVSSY